MKTKKLRKQVRELRQAVDLAKSASRQTRLKALQRAVKAAGNTDAGRALSLLEARERMTAEKADAISALARLGSNETGQARAIYNAAAPAVGRAQGPAQRPPGARVSDPRRNLQSIFDGTYRRESLPVAETELRSLRRNHEVDTELADDARIQTLKRDLDVALKSTTSGAMERVAALSYQLTKAELAQGHRRGEI